MPLWWWSWWLKAPPPSVVVIWRRRVIITAVKTGIKIVVKVVLIDVVNHGRDSVHSSSPAVHSLRHHWRRHRWWSHYRQGTHARRRNANWTTGPRNTGRTNWRITVCKLKRTGKITGQYGWMRDSLPTVLTGLMCHLYDVARRR